MKKKRNLYIIAFLCFITLVGVTIAYLQSTDTFENIFNAGTYRVVTHEEFTSPSNWKPGDTIPKTISSKNEGTIPVMIRVKLDQSWTSLNDTELPIYYTTPDGTFIYKYDDWVDFYARINFINKEDWLYYSDGYYYYLKELLPGEETSYLFDSVAFNPNYEGNVTCTYNSTTNSNECLSSNDGYMGATYNLSITTESVESDAYREVWETAPEIYSYVGDRPCTYNGELEVGSKYVNGEYTYTFRQDYFITRSKEKQFYDNYSIGWTVELTDKDSTGSVTSPLCSSINNIPITSMVSTFQDSKATSIDLSTFDTSNVTSMLRMFWRSQVTSLDMRSFNTSRVTNMGFMFSDSQAISLDMSSFDTSNVEYVPAMFQNSKAPILDLSSFDTSKLTKRLCTLAIFSGCSATTGYARTQADADKFNGNSRPEGLTFVVKDS